MEDTNNVGNVSQGSLPPRPPQDEILRMDDETAQNQDVGNESGENNEDKDQSNIDNIIPLEKLKNGWFQLSAFVSTQATIAHAKAVEAYNSETAQNYRRKSVEAYDKTAEIAAPYWESAKATAITVGEKTKESVAQVAENLKPTVEVVGEKMNQAAKVVVDSTASAVVYAQAKYNESVSGSSSSSSSSSSSGGVSSSGASDDHTPSALDTATKGGPMVL